MASRSGSGWRGQVRIVGYPPEFKSFPKKGEAVFWEENRKKELRAGKRGDYPKKTVLEALQRFREEEAPHHKGERWERVRTLRFERYAISQKVIGDVTDDDMAHWRQARLKEVAGSTVRREMVLWGQVFEAAREKWRWIPKNIMRDVKKPSPAPPNPKEVPQSRIDKMVETLGAAHKKREVALGFLLGCETAMRPWEMLGLEKIQVDWRECVAHLVKTKNGDDRDVPLSPSAVEILAELDRMNEEASAFFTVTRGSVTSFWTEAREAAGYKKGFHFRHSRAVGIRKLSKRLPLLDLARAVGHRDLNSLRHYYYESASDMARRLAHQSTPSLPQPSTSDGPLPRISPASET